MLYAATDHTRIDFTIPSDNALRRIIVDPDVKPVGTWLGNKHIEQLSTYIKGAKADQAFITPPNLTTTTSCSVSIATSSVWSDFTFTQIGNVGNQASSGDVSGFDRAEKLDPLPVSHYMTETESHMIEQWAGHVVEAANPNEPIPTTPILEGQKRVGRTRVVKQVEDDEDEDTEPDVPLAIPSLTPQSMNDALNSHFNAQRAKVGRRRVKRIDEDEDEDDEELQDNTLTNNAEQQDSWTYPPLPQPKGFGYSSMPSKRRLGRQRVVKVDSDDEIEDNGSTWASHKEQQSRNDNKSTIKSSHVSPDEAAIIDGWGETVCPQMSGGWAENVHSEVSNGWDDTVYPEISSFGVTNDSFGRKQTSDDGLNQTTMQKNSVSDRNSDRKPDMATDVYSSFAAKTPGSNRGKETPAKGQGRGRGSRGQGPGHHRGASSTQAAMLHTHDSRRISHIPQTSKQQYRGQSHNRGKRASRGTTPSGQGRGRGNQGRHDGNRFATLAAETLVDIADSDVVDHHAIPPPPGFEHQPHIDGGTAQGVRSQSNISDAPSNPDLIDVTTPEAKKNTHVPPPPGFDSFSNAGTQNWTRHQRNPSSVPPSGSPSDSVGTQSVLSVANTGAFYVNTPNPGMDLMEMSRRRLEQLHRARGEEGLLENEAESLQAVDESSTRTYHRTMKQQAKKPASKKKEADQKKAAALQDAWGSGSGSGSGPASGKSKASDSTAARSSRKTETSDMSAAKKRLLQGQEAMTNSQSTNVSEDQLTLQNEHFVDALRPVFTAARAFPGSLNFEVQLGQFLSPSPEGAYQAKCVTVNQWHKLYDSTSGRLASAATFTNILTRNGADIEHILKLKMAQNGGAKLFHPDKPGRFGIRFEFHCQGKNNDEFKLVFNSRGEYEIERPFRKIGQINIHVPGQIWDAAGLLTGSTRFPEEQILKDAADEMARSIYIPGGRKEIEISYHQPSSNEFAVKRVVMRRVSRHTCALMGKHDVQLQITEVQRLFVERRSDGIYLAFASKYEKMVDQMMIHFEVSLISESIEHAMSANAYLTVGDITSAWTEDSLLQTWRTKALLEITQMVVSKIDGVGFHNVGSAVFFLGQDSVLGGGSAMAIGSAMPSQQQPPNQQSMTKLATQNTRQAAIINVPGVRGGLAQPVEQGYALGYGGARIPIPGHVEPDAVVPDDSASQAPERGKVEGQQLVPGFW